MKQGEEPSKRLVSSGEVDYEYSILFRRSKNKSVETKLTQEVMGTKSRDPTFRVPHTQRSS